MTQKPELAFEESPLKAKSISALNICHLHIRESFIPCSIFSSKQFLICTAPEQAERPLAIEDDRTDARTNLFSSKVVLRADKMLIIPPANAVHRSTPEQTDQI